MVVPTSSSPAPQEELPIDIYYSKLLEWLIDRKRVSPDWQAQVLVIREKITAALQDMPDVPEITSLLQGSFINYFHCLKIVELLKVSESSSKNIFGHYSSQRMKDWLDITKSYEKGFVYLGECAHMIIQNVNYEISAMKKTINKTQQQLKELDIKEANYLSNANQYRAEFQLMCRDLKIEGLNVKEELCQLVNELSPLYKSLVESVREKHFADACLFYKTFLDFTLPANGSRQSSETLPMITYLSQKGNVTVHEWKTNEPVDISDEPTPTPTSTSTLTSTSTSKLTESKTNSSSTSTSTTSDSEPIEINWDDISTDNIQYNDTDAAGGDIVWDIDVIDTSASSKEADLISTEPTTDESGDATKSSDTIEWGIETVVEGDVEKTNAANIETSAEIDFGIGSPAGPSSSTAKSTTTTSRSISKETILEATETRNLFINDLLELQGFLTQRLLEVNVKSNNIIGMNMFASAPVILHDQSPQFINDCLSAVQKVLTSLTKSRAQQLILIKTSPRYVDHLADNLLQKLKSSQRMQSRAKQVDEKRTELTELIKSTHKEMAKTIGQTKELQKQVENVLSKIYAGRRVNIIGEINAL